MDQPGGSRPAGQPQEGKDVVGQQHPADQQPRHVQQEQAVDQGSEPPRDGPRPPGQGGVPPAVEEVVDQEEGQGPGPHPFVGPLPPQVVPHEEPQAQGHEQVHHPPGGPLPHRSWRPRR